MRPADTNACAVQVAKIATSEIEATECKTQRAKSSCGGAKARVEKQTDRESAEIDKKAANAPWVC